MANKSRRRGTKKNKQVNPLYRRAVGFPRPKLNFDGSVVSGSIMHTLSSTLANAASFALFCDCSNTSGGAASNYNQSVAANIAGLTGLYAEYKYLSMTVEWLPIISPGVIDAGSRVYVGYTDNPEVIASLSASAAVATRDAVKGNRNMRSFNAWEHFRMNVPLTNRHNKFNVNTNSVLSDSNTIDRSVQGLVYGGIDGVSAAATLGTWRTTYKLQLMNLEITAPAT